MPRSDVLPALALSVNAFVWGLSWWPFRLLQERGLHPLWSTALVYLTALACVLLWRPGAFRILASRRPLWLLAAAAGMTNVCFNWGVTEGDVVRVVLLFYLMPLWSMLLAWPLLGERPGPAALARTALALAGVVVVLKAPGSAWPVPVSLTDWLGVAGGLGFALANLLLLRLRAVPEAARLTAMFAGGMATAIVVAAIATATGAAASPGAWQPTFATTALVATLALAFVAGNIALQYGAARLPAGTTALVMLSEVVFASVSSVALGAAEMTLRIALGGAMVLAAGIWSALTPPPRPLD